jgi:hypothetical protein
MPRVGQSSGKAYVKMYDEQAKLMFEDYDSETKKNEKRREESKREI